MFQVWRSLNQAGNQLYNTLKALGWEWREKPNLGQKKALEPGEEPDPREDSDIFFLETRCRIKDVVVRLPLSFYFLFSDL
jgi:carbon catabolite-derepressing protein kinase